MATKNLVRTGASLMNHMLVHSNRNPSAYQQIASRGLEITTPQLFPSLSKLQNSIHFPQNDADLSNVVSSQGFLYPCGLPSLRFFLPDVDTANEPMLLFPKRTFQPSLIRRKRNHGFFARKATKGGRKVIARRIAKGRSRITA